MNKERGKLSKREFAALKGTSGSSKVASQPEAKKAASSSVSKSSNSLAKAQKSYLKSLAPSKEEKVALKTQQKLLTNQELETNKIRDPKQNAVAAPFVAGQIDRLDSDTASKTIPLKYQIAALQSNRESKAKIAGEKYSFAAKRSSAKEVDPLDTEYKQLRNEKAKVSLNKAKKGGSGNSQKDELKIYNAQKSENTARGLVSLPKGVSGPPAPKVLIQKKTKGGRKLPGA